MSWVLAILLLLCIAALAALGMAYAQQARRLREHRDNDHHRQQQLRQRLASESARRNELEALLSSMAEGVVAVDLDGALLNLNRAGAKLMRIDRDAALGKPYQQVLRHTGVQQLLGRTLQEGSLAQDELTWALPGDSVDRPLILQAQTAPLHDGEGGRIGALLVVHDVTQVRRLESVRRDFVANVSHEVKTPVAAIKAAVETLLDDHTNAMPRDDAERFMRIIARQAERLNAIVEDLLALARIEQAPDGGPLHMPVAEVRPVLEAAAETCAANAEAKQITLQLDADATLCARMTPSMIEQAVTNLIDNAIKYSPERTVVSVRVRRDQADVVIEVTDQGRGIEAEHLDRIFERFYRTDRARSRALGGTGLGLSIVKHIADAHGGRVGVESRAGHGSTFRLYLVAAEPDAGQPDADTPAAA